MIGKGEIIVIILVLLVVFGANRFPQMMRSMADGIKEFKKGLNEADKDAEAKPVKKSVAKKTVARKRKK